MSKKETKDYKLPGSVKVALDNPNYTQELKLSILTNMLLATPGVTVQNVTKLVKPFLDKETNDKVASILKTFGKDISPKEFDQVLNNPNHTVLDIKQRKADKIELENIPLMPTNTPNTKPVKIKPGALNY